MRTPHLSSIDAIALSILAFERFADGADLGSHHVARVELRAPQQPYTDLDAVPVSLHVKGDPRQSNLALDANVAGLRVHLELHRHDGIGPRVHADGQPIYSEGFRHTRIASSLEPRNTASAITATHLFEIGPKSDPQRSTGVESDFAPAITVIDLLVTLGQMTQAAIYSSLPVEQRRGDLWMRSITIEVSGRPLPLPFAGQSTTVITRERIIDRNGQKVHDIDVESTLETSVRARARLAYIEPAATSAPSSAGA